MDVDNILAENAALKRKLQSKTEALLILNQELNKCIDERNRSKNLERSFNDSTNQSSAFYQLSTYKLAECSNCKQLASYQRDNASLRLENEELKQHLSSAHGDIKVLRQEKKSNCEKENSNWHGREALVASLESASERVKQLESDLATVLDEKQELISDRDLYRCKVHRLNHQLTSVLQAPKIDIDCLILENKCLHDRLVQAQADKELLQHNLAKYKTMLEKKRNKGAVQIGTVASCEGMVVSHKQVQELLESHMINSEATLADLRSLCLAMLESLQDKSLALAHHKKTTKLLASRISDLEALLSKDSNIILFPSKVIMESYSSSHVDKDLSKITIDDISDDGLDADVDEKCKLNEEEESVVARSENEDSLPPELQALVYKAIQDINNRDSNAIQ